MAVEDWNSMPGRGANVRVVAIGVAAVAALVVGLGALTWITRSSGPVVRVVSEEGGVSVAAPRNWKVDKLHPTDPDHQEFLNGHESAALGILQRGGFWVARWPAAKTETPRTIGTRMRTEQREKQRDDWSVREEPLAGHRAVVLRYAEPPKSLERIRLGDVKTKVREFIAGGYVFQVGTWTLPHPGPVTKKLEQIAQSVEVFEPKPWQSEHLTLPGGWVERDSDLPGAIFHALSPGAPNEAWAYVFRYPDDSPAATLSAATRKIPANGGRIISQRDDTLGGRKAVRVDFTFLDDGYGEAIGVEWLLNDRNGGTFVLAIGRRAGDEGIAERLAATWRVT